VAVIKGEKSKALAALTTAALGLPGIKADAAVPVTQAQGNVQYGYYQESDDRIKVDVYHGDFTLPVTDRMEFFFSVDRDTYSGATPAFSLPETMTNQLKYTLSQGKDAAPADVVSAASPRVTASGLITLGGINTFKAVRDGFQTEGGLHVTPVIDRERAERVTNPRNEEDRQFRLDNPPPSAPPTIPGPVTINFDGIARSGLGGAVYGNANMAPTVPGGRCPGLSDCYRESGFMIGASSDHTNEGAHLHAAGTVQNRAANYHNDSAGMYFRALDGEAFRLESLRFRAPFSAASNPAGGFWKILGFNTPFNPDLSRGDGTNYPTRVALQTVDNPFDGVLTLNEDFSNIHAFWIHYNGYPTTPADGKTFSVEIDDVKMDKARFPHTTPELEAWLAAYNAFTRRMDAKYAPVELDILKLETELLKPIIIGQYRSLLNQPVLPKARTVQRFQYQPLETRTMPVFGTRYYFDTSTLGLSYGQSNEPDWHSTFGNLNYALELNDKLTTLSAGYNYTHNRISRGGLRHAIGHQHGESDSSPQYPELNETSQFHGINLGLSQILSKNSLLQLSANYTRQSGYLSNPYKFVYIRGEVTAEEYYLISRYASEGIDWGRITNLEMVGLELFRDNRPDSRNLFSLSSRLNQYLPALDAAVHLDYRFYADDWDVHSHTFQLQWIQQLPWGLTVTPNLRYYSQTQADFFAPYFLAPRADGFYSSDFRLSDFGALAGGVTVSKRFNRGIRLDLGVEYYTHRGDLKLGGGGEDGYADFSYWMTHARLNVDLSAPGQIFGEGGDDDHPHHHLHHGAAAPAGVMFGHMLDKAGDIMVGYRYMYANQTGDLLRGSRPASDRILLGQSCGTEPCDTRPTEMSMHMHMLDLMYAPTDWLNFMLMPQLVDMKMKLQPLNGVTGENEHAGTHESHGLGDTLMATLVKVFDTPVHHVHVGLGISAPTGDVDVTLDGRDEKDSLLQDYGMQLGSGTWDFRPSLTYVGHADDWHWGAQVSGSKRLENRNESGYVLGDLIQATAWGSYRFTPWLAASVRGIYTEQGKIRGEFNRPSTSGATVDSPANYGGKFWDVGFGLNLTVPTGAFAGHGFNVEWLQPVADKFNGYQLEREGSLFATWNYAF
jgi:hypothetical protein